MRVVKKLNRSVFVVRYQVKGSFNLGEICPIGSPIEITPYDTINLDAAMVIRMATPIAPIMDDLDAEITAHFVPFRLLGSDTGASTNPGYVASVVSQNTKRFELLIANGLGNPVDWMQTDNEIYTAPTAVWNAATAKAAGYTTIGEALGLGLGCGTSRNQEVLAYPLYGYNLIYQERFRNEDVEAAKGTLARGSNLYGASGSPTATTGTDGTYNHSLSVAYKHGDFYTNAKPAPSKGAEVKIPLGSTAPILLGSSYDLDYFKNPLNSKYYGPELDHITVVDNSDLIIGQTSGKDEQTVASQSTTNIYTDLSQATAASINSFITAFNIQRLLMKDIKGTRYFEIIKNHFGIENDDIRLYIPELLNIRRFAINISPVVQQSGAAAATSGTDQGNYLGTTGGYSFTANKGAMVHHTFGEFGYIYFLIVIRQSHTYGQGVPKMFLRSKRFDFFYPELGRIGYQKIDNIQLNADEAPGTTYGWQPAWEELRKVADNQVFGFMNPAKNNSLDYWTLAENLPSTPQLDMAFLKENRANLARALTIADQGPDFIMDAMIYGKKATLVPIGSEPKLFN